VRGMPGALPARLERRRGAAQARDAAPRGAAMRRPTLSRTWVVLLALGVLAAAPASARMLVPMDETQTDHLKAYGLTYWVLSRGQKAEWLLNYRGGSFLLADDPATQREANLRG